MMFFATRLQGHTSGQNASAKSVICHLEHNAQKCWAFPPTLAFVHTKQNDSRVLGHLFDLIFEKGDASQSVIAGERMLSPGSSLSPASFVMLLPSLTHLPCYLTQLPPCHSVLLAPWRGLPSDGPSAPLLLSLSRGRECSTGRGWSFTTSLGIFAGTHHQEFSQLVSMKLVSTQQICADY